MSLYNLEALKEWTGFDQRARVIRWLDENGIKWHKGKGGQPLTTLTQIDASFENRHEEIEFL